MNLAYLPLCAAVALAGCASRDRGAVPQGTQAVVAAPDWRSIATDHDRQRIRQWRTAWMQGVQKAQGSGHGAAIAREGVLLQPDAALAWAPPPAGYYQCRMIKVGAKSRDMLDYVAYPPFSCRIREENGVMSFAKLNGSQRPLGLLLPTSGNRMVFLGTLQLGDEVRALEYGRDQERDMAGMIERIGEQRWRLVLPYPHFESTIDILELVPRGSAPPAS